jgi:hypothetical protein
MAAKEVEEFRDLVLRGPRGNREMLRSALIERASSPWRHAEDVEEDLEHTNNAIAFQRDAGGGIDAATVFLWPHVGGGYEVTNIVPRGGDALGYRKYNIVLDDFVTCLAKPAADATGFKIETTAAMQGLEDWLPEGAATALRRFSTGANKATGSSHPSDRHRWCLFILTAHRDHGSFNTERLMRWLHEAEGWPEDVAHDLAVEYEFGLDLLKEHERTST